MTTPKTGPITHAIVERRVGELFIDSNVQRSLAKARAEKMAEEFDPDALGVLTTSYRSPRRVHVIDGQHRLYAATAAHYTGVIITQEYRGLSIPEEAALFRKLNTAQKPSKIDSFIVACVEQDPDALRLAGFLSDNGWSVASSGSEGRLSAIGSLQRVYTLSPTAAASALAVLTKAFGHRPAAVQGNLIEGLGRMLAKYEGMVDLNALAEKMAAVPGGPDGIVGNARGQSFTSTGNLSSAVAGVIVKLYNVKRRSSALAPWS